METACQIGAISFYDDTTFLVFTEIAMFVNFSRKSGAESIIFRNKVNYRSYWRIIGDLFSFYRMQNEEKVIIL